LSAESASSQELLFAVAQQKLERGNYIKIPMPGMPQSSRQRDSAVSFERHQRCSRMRDLFRPVADGVLVRKWKMRG